MGVWTLVLPNWSRYLRNSRTWAPLHRERESGGRWFFRYCPKVFQSRRFWFSYRLLLEDEDEEVTAKPLAVLVLLTPLPVLMTPLLLVFSELQVVLSSSAIESIEREKKKWENLLKGNPFFFIFFIFKDRSKSTNKKVSNHVQFCSCKLVLARVSFGHESERERERTREMR